MCILIETVSQVRPMSILLWIWDIHLHPFYCKSCKEYDLFLCILFVPAEITCGFGQLYRPTLTVTPKKDYYLYNETVSLQCDTGYILRGPSTTRCTENFVFDDVPDTLDCEGKKLLFCQCFVCFRSRSRVFHQYEDVTIAGEGLWHWTFCGLVNPKDPLQQQASGCSPRSEGNLM